MRFPVSGVEIHPVVPALVSFCISSLMATAGVSGAFVLLPFQVSVLGFVGPAVTPTNHLFNVVAIPSGVYRYVREGRMVWPLALVIIVGTIPGVIFGSLARVYLLDDARRFKLFAGFVLLLIGSRLLRKVVRSMGASLPWFRTPGPAPAKHNTSSQEAATAARPSEHGNRLHVRTVRFDLRRLEYEYDGQVHGISTVGLGALTAVIGLIGGAYGVGGGAIIAPFLVSVFELPVHTIAGATLAGTCLTSMVGVGFFTLLAPLIGRPGIAPDWLLGLLFGSGGLGGMYCGARLQRFVPAPVIEAGLAVVVMSMALRYIAGYFWS